MLRTDLKKFNGDLPNRAMALVGHLNELGTTWRDQENKKFPGSQAPAWEPTSAKLCLARIGSGASGMCVPKQSLGTRDAMPDGRATSQAALFEDRLDTGG